VAYTFRRQNVEFLNIELGVEAITDIKTVKCCSLCSQGCLDTRLDTTLESTACGSNMKTDS
jgi:hypothetical protein